MTAPVTWGHVFWPGGMEWTAGAELVFGTIDVLARISHVGTRGDRAPFDPSKEPGAWMVGTQRRRRQWQVGSVVEVWVESRVHMSLFSHPFSYGRPRRSVLVF